MFFFFKLGYSKLRENFIKYHLPVGIMVLLLFVVLDDAHIFKNSFTASVTEFSTLHVKLVRVCLILFIAFHS